MDATSTYVIRELAKDPYAWRIDWFGAVTYSERHQRPSQPLIEVQVSKVPDDLGHISEFFHLRKLQWPSTRRLRLPVGFLPMLRVGDVWRDGRLNQTPDYEIANFANLNVSNDGATLIKAGLPDETTGEYYLPLDVHPYHMSFTQSYCVHVQHHGANILIPCAELLRFYFGSSSTLVARLFDAPFRQENFWFGQQEIDPRGLAKIKLAAGVPGRSATDIGRIAFSKASRNAAELIGNSCVAATARGEAAYLKAVFPFYGETNLSATGLWMPSQSKEHGTFVVFRLRSCSHQFPFDRLQYTSERAQGRSTDPSKSAQGQPSTSSFSSRRQDPKILSAAEPSRSKRSRRLGVYFGDMQFPDLARKPVSRVDSDESPTVQLSKHGLTIIDDSSVGGEGSTTSIQPIELSTAEATRTLNAETTGDRLQAKILLQLLLYLTQLPGILSVDVVRLSPRQRYDYLSTMPQIVDDEGELSANCLVAENLPDERGKVSTRFRLVSVGRSLELYRTCYFLVPEQQDKDAVELYVFIDHSRCIRTTRDLLGAIAVQFSTQTEDGQVLDLHEGVTSCRFTATCTNDLPMTDVIDHIWGRALRFLMLSSEGTGTHSKINAPTVPEYLR